MLLWRICDRCEDSLAIRDDVVSHPTKLHTHSCLCSQNRRLRERESRPSDWLAIGSTAYGVIATCRCRHNALCCWSAHTRIHTPSIHTKQTRASFAPAAEQTRPKWWQNTVRWRTHALGYIKTCAPSARCVQIGGGVLSAMKHALALFSGSLYLYTT